MSTAIRTSHEYRQIAAHYAGRTARRSGVPLIAHIDGGLAVLTALGASSEALRAFCLHPLVQADVDLAAVAAGPGLRALSADAHVLALVFEYRATANAALANRELAAAADIALSPLAEVNHMLIADKVQNRADFERHHAASHPRAARLARYFALWLERLGVSEARYAALRAEVLPPDASVAVFTGDRAQLLPLFREADDAAAVVARYVELGDVLIAGLPDAPLGHVQLIPDPADSATWELKSLAVAPAARRTGLGRALLEAGVAHAAARGARRIVLSTGAADAALLRFYQRRGFRFLRIERDVFTPAHGYPPGLAVDGIPLLDQVWFERLVPPSQLVRMLDSY